MISLKIRQDAWTVENDALLAETVLRHIREGSTQLNAFEEVGDILNRTSAACGFRWNAVVRNDYIEAIELAKKQRKELKRQMKRQKEENVQVSTPIFLPDGHSQTLTLNEVIHFLQTLNYESNQTSTLKVEHEKLRVSNQMLQEKIHSLEQEKEKLQKDYLTIQEDYQSFMEIMERARKMVLFTEDEPKTTFRMEKNGNLEKVAK